MKTNRWLLIFSKVAIVLLIFWTASARGAVDFARMDMELQSVITNKASSQTDLLQAISRLGRVAEHASFWTTIANDPTYSAEHRRRCAMAFFRRHGRFCTGLRQLAGMLSPSNWFEKGDIEEVRSVFGAAPVEVTEGDTVFKIRIFPSQMGPQANVFIKLLGKV